MDLLQLGKNCISKLASSLVEPSVGYSYLPTGIIGIDKLLNGGLYSGTLTEIFGLESTGKTSLILSIVKNVQQQGKIVCIIDDEYSITTNYANSIGIDPNKLLIAHPFSGEQTIFIAQELLSSGAVDLLIIDSLAGVVSNKELIESMSNKSTTLQYEIINKLLEELRKLTIQYGTPIIFTNQLRSGRYNNKFNIRTVASNLVRKFSTTRLYLNKLCSIYHNIENVGIKINIRKVKGCLNLFNSTDVVLFYGEGVSNESSLLLLPNSPITKSGTWYMYKDKKLGQGIIQSINTLKTNPKLYEEIINNNS